MQRDASYYSERMGRVSARGLDDLRLGLRTLHRQVAREGLLQVHLGYHCVDAGFVPGSLGEDVEDEASYLTGVRILPFDDRVLELEEHELFTAVEFLHTYASLPTESWFHSFNDCGIHAQSGDDEQGRAMFRERVNPILSRYSAGFELTGAGEVWRTGITGLDAALPETVDDSAVDAKVERATSRYFHHAATSEDKRDACRDLMDVLEYLRSSTGTRLLRRDEDRLFEIANFYGVRHHEPDQRTDYDAEIWLDWYFGNLLGAVRLVTRLMNRDAEYESTRCPACHQLSLYDDSYGEVDSDGALVGGNFKACTNCSWTSI